MTWVLSVEDVALLRGLCAVGLLVSVLGLVYSLAMYASGPPDDFY